MAVPAGLGTLAHIGVRGACLDHLAADQGRALAHRIEALGFATLWIPESTGHEVFSQASLLLGATDRIVVGTGIANIYARDPSAMAAGSQTLADAHPGRFVLGLGVSHAPMIERRGHEYRAPVTFLGEYLDAMDDAPYRAPAPAVPAPRVLGALGPRSLRMAGERGLGAHPYFVPVEHTRRARDLLGPDSFLAPEVAFVDATDREVARRLAGPYVRRHLALDNYRANLLRLGLTDADLDPTPGDRLLDAVVGWGGPDALRERVAAHLDAGADHVVAHPVATVDAPDGALAGIFETLARDLLD